MQEWNVSDWRSAPYAVVFPGQGAQFVGMAAGLATDSRAARAALDTANSVLGFDLAGLMSEGPAETLEDTYNAQPAILAASIAAVRAIEEVTGEPLVPAVVAGHSLGEFSALVLAEVLTYEDALRLVRERGRIMKAAGNSAPGAMAAVLGLDDEQLEAVCAEASVDGVVVIANRNCPGQTVISGDIAALERASELAKERGAKRVARLGVSIASHSPLMAAAAAEFGAIVAETALADPSVPVIANGSAQPMTTVQQVIDEISAQMAAQVNWTGSVQTMLGMGVTTFLDVGPGAVIAGLNKRIDRSTSNLGLADLGLGLPSAS
jgi:[acyl-carrier-protein] S-malonyltransferase